ncbi:MAG: L-lactate permease [Pedosphaera sp.]|nr:L-lactate permease [Pedosphaera sp.]
MTWAQHYDPLHNATLSTLVAALPVVVLLGAIALFKVRIHLAALLGLAVALSIALGVYAMPVKAALATTAFGAAYGLFPIGWIILNLIFLHTLTVKSGLFDVLRQSLARLAPDPRVQVILIAFSFGAFFEGAAGFGTPVAVTAAILMQLGFKPLQASGLSLIANTAPVAFGALGTPIIALSKVTGISEFTLSQMVGRQLPFFSLIVPFWVVWAMAGWRGMIGVWPAALTAGVAFAVPQFLVSNFHGPWLVDIVAAVCSIAAMVVLLKFWKPKENEEWRMKNEETDGDERKQSGHSSFFILNSSFRAWLPWILLSALVFVWGLPAVKKSLDTISAPAFAVAGLHEVVVRTPPVVAAPTADKPTKPEEAIFKLNWLSATGTGILVAAVIAGLLMGFSPRELLRHYGATLVRVRFSLITIAAMLAIGYVTRYSGTDVTLGLALAKTGTFYPFFGTLLGWLGVALTGSDTASNVIFGSLQKITAEQTGINPTLMAAANSSGGVMGKMVDAQSIVVASTATNWYGHEGSILRYVFFHSLALAVLMGILVLLQAYVAPFTSMVVK